MKTVAQRGQGGNPEEHDLIRDAEIDPEERMQRNQHAPLDLVHAAETSLPYS